MPQVPLWQKSLISSQLDIDRLDYLRRDSLCSGAEYGNFDCFRIIHTMQLQEYKEKERRQKGIFIVWPEKTKYALEEYIFSRFYMYQSVYFHHTTRGFECLLRKILDRAKDLDKKDSKFATEMLPPMKMILGTRYSKNLKSFQQLTDDIMFAQISIWQHHRDKILSDLSNRLMSRSGLGWAEKTGTSMVTYEQTNEVKRFLHKKNIDERYYFFYDETQATAYKPYSSASSPEELSSVSSILLYNSSWQDTGFKEISDVPGLNRISAITKSEAAILRCYFPKEFEKEIQKILR